MKHRSRVPLLLAIVATLAVAAACVPAPIGRPSPTAATPRPSATVAPTAEPAPTGPTPVPSFVRPTPTPLPSFLAYVVQAGDTLTSIARAHDTTARSIAFWNRESYPSLDPDSPGYRPGLIEVGWTLVLLPGTVVDESELPEASPTPAPPDALGPSRRITNGPRSSSMVALTFDLGGRLDPALDIMSWLVEHEVPATIFPTGKTGTTTEVGLAVLAAVRDHPELFDLGNHSWSHPDFRDLETAEILDQLARTEEALVDAIGVSPRPWFRPPEGGVDESVLRDVGEAGYASTVLWDVDTIDWRPMSDGGPSAADIVDKVVTRAEGGSIVLMHLGGYHTRSALPGIVDGLRDRGLEPVTLDEMFGS